MGRKIKCRQVKVLVAQWSLFVTPWTIAHQAPLSMEFSRQEYWSRLPFPTPGSLPDPGIEPTSPPWQAYSLPLSHLGSPFLLCIVINLEVKNKQNF